MTTDIDRAIEAAAQAIRIKARFSVTVPFLEDIIRPHIEPVIQIIDRRHRLLHASCNEVARLRFKGCWQEAVNFAGLMSEVLIKYGADAPDTYREFRNCSKGSADVDTLVNLAREFEDDFSLLDLIKAAEACR